VLLLRPFVVGRCMDRYGIFVKKGAFAMQPNDGTPRVGRLSYRRGRYALGLLCAFEYLLSFANAASIICTFWVLSIPACWHAHFEGDWLIVAWALIVVPISSGLLMLRPLCPRECGQHKRDHFLCHTVNASVWLFLVTVIGMACLLS